MALTLYRRHRRECKAGHPHNSFSTEFEERKRGWVRCECPIVCSGTLQKKFKRHSTNLWQWDDARAVAAKFEASGSWGEHVKEIDTSLEPVKNIPKRVQIADATAAYLARCQGRNIRPTSYAKYKTFVNQLHAFAEKHGFHYLDQLGVAEMDLFYGSWKDGVKARAKKLDRLKAFIKFCVKREWLAKDIASDLQAPIGSSVPFPKTPFTDDELKRIYDACDQIKPTKVGPGYRTWDGEDAKDFIYLSVYTGLRISDVATFDINERLVGNNVFIHAQKNNANIYTWIPDWLVNRLKAREQQHGPMIFKCGVSFTMKQLTDIWRGKRLAKVFELAGPWPTKPTPHIFRHTFVRMLLEKGVPVADVAELIGDTEEIVRRHYSRWVTSRQDRLSRILQDALDDKPKPAAKIVRIR